MGSFVDTEVVYGQRNLLCNGISLFSHPVEPGDDDESEGLLFSESWAIHRINLSWYLIFSEIIYGIIVYL
jgi:hypothetical protein